MDSKSIEAFFLNTLLKIATGGVLIITLVDILLYPEDRLSVIIDLVMLGTCLLAYAMRTHAPVISMVIFTSVLLSAMVYQSLAVPLNTTISLSVMLLDGFIVSVMLKRQFKILMHTLIVGSVISIFIIQYVTPELRFSTNANELITIAVTYLILYFILAYPTSVLKGKYDLVTQDLNKSNDALTLQTRDMSEQNAALLNAQNELAMLNGNLERILNERTARIQAQNEILVRYSYNNAHHLRGPVARLLGLAAVYKMDATVGADFIIEKMVDQAHEIDTVVKLINEDLEAQNLSVQ
jgi:signal transduction histidine kinase